MCSDLGALNFGPVSVPGILYCRINCVENCHAQYTEYRIMLICELIFSLDYE